MLASCPQDVFFHHANTHNVTRARHFQRQPSRKDDRMLGLNVNDRSDMSSSSKDKEEQVWPSDVESAFIEALESIPKLGRRKILVNGKPCGRNELISDFIYRKTCKIRTRKQVSSHIQVLKNTRKGDSHFMRLLTDSVDNDDTTTIKAKARPLHYHYPMPNHRHSHMGVKIKTTYQSIDSLSSDDSSINSSPSPTDYIFDMRCNDQQQLQQQQHMLSMFQFKDMYDPMQPSLFPTPTSMNPLDLMTDPFFGSSTADNTDILSTPLLEEEHQLVIPAVEHELFIHRLDEPMTISNSSSSSSNISSSSSSSSLKQYPLWPNYLCLYLEYTMPYDPSGRSLTHNLSQLAHCDATSVASVSHSVISAEKCPLMSTLAPFNTLIAKAKLDLNLSIADFAFNNTSFFETKTRRSIECTTTIYSFGHVVLKSKEVQQALWVNEEKYMYGFVFVNQFFDAFMKGIRSLQSWHDVDIAIHNLCIVQSFQDEASSNTDPLLVMVYEFERGDGVIQVASLGEEETSPPRPSPPQQQQQQQQPLLNNQEDTDDLDFLDHDR